jgi:uncharacterized protein (TIGR01777 family)
MKVLITGGLGFVGTQLSIRLLKGGDQVTVVDHSPQPRPYTPSEVHYIAADTTMPGTWQDAIAAQDAVINLTGASIFRRWTAQTKQLMYNSRILTTRNVVDAMPANPANKDTLLCSTSAVGYYGFHGDEELTEEDGPGTDFLARLAADWEGEAQRAGDKGVRVTITRFGLVLGKTGGVLGQMIPLFKKFMGGPLGSGRQWFSWIHMEDLLSAFMFVFNNKQIHGPVNFCSPNPVRNRDLARALGEVLSRPAVMPTPAFVLRLVLGEFGSVVLEGQRVIPSCLLRQGFVFQYPETRGALREVIGKPG